MSEIPVDELQQRGKRPDGLYLDHLPAPSAHPTGSVLREADIRMLACATDLNHDIALDCVWLNQEASNYTVVVSLLNDAVDAQRPRLKSWP